MGLCDKLLNLDRNTSITQYLANLSNADFMQEADSLPQFGIRNSL